eukprot:TRINITY_DN6832_c0_g1_i1.p1 TRINITY_DN6832_c0_g1~~TRINITY_DN6832_c0_g1_i1.p1  ORF type:complete len:143 (+),score=30.16 TRINITY_DN6832_c0_g1_i1:33-431(+)
MGALSYLSGAVFATAWWFFIDGAAIKHDGSYDFVMWLPGLFGTLSFILINFTKPSDLNQDDPLNEGSGNRAKIGFFVSLLVGFTAIIVAVWVMVDKTDMKGTFSGTSLIVQSVLLLVAGVIFWVGRNEKTEI